MTTLFSEEQLVALSKVFEAAIASAASASLALRSMIEANVAGTHAEGWRAAGVGSADIVLRTGSDDEIGLLHQFLRRFLGDRRRQALNEIRRQTEFL